MWMGGRPGLWVSGQVGGWVYGWVENFKVLLEGLSRDIALEKAVSREPWRRPSLETTFFRAKYLESPPPPSGFFVNN